VTLDPRLLAWRHALHRIPETAFEEHKTSAYVARVLTDLGYDVVTDIGGTGLVGSLTQGSSGRAVALRSELDALPITEDSGAEHPSKHPGTMHACGHDGHLAMLLGAAAHLAEEGEFDGTVRVLFQPASWDSTCSRAASFSAAFGPVLVPLTVEVGGGGGRSWRTGGGPCERARFDGRRQGYPHSRRVPAPRRRIHERLNRP
jgi:Peptidase family M20/M25/M40